VAISTSYRDDRGTPVSRYHAGGIDADDAAPRDLAMRALYVSKTASRFWMWGVLILGLVVFAVLEGVGLPSLVAAPVALMAVLVPGVLLTRSSHHELQEQLRLTLVASGRCAQCGYRLIEVAPGQDGCTQCPECGAAWRLDPSLRESVGEMFTSRALPKAGNDGETASDRRDRLAMRDFLWGLVGGKRHLATTDDRGRLVDVVDPNVRRRRPAHWDDVRPQDQRIIRKRLALLGWPKRLIAFLLVTPWLTLEAYLTIQQARLGNPLDLHHVLFAILGTLWTIGLALYVFRAQPGSGHPIKRIMLARGYCPTCAANLLAVPPDADRCRVCRHCRSAWRLAVTWVVEQGTR
jgi:hypothetical protein